MEVNKISKYRILTRSERVLIAGWKNKGLSNKDIAKLAEKLLETTLKVVCIASKKQNDCCSLLLRNPPCAVLSKS